MQNVIEFILYAGTFILLNHHRKLYEIGTIIPKLQIRKLTSKKLSGKAKVDVQVYSLCFLQQDLHVYFCLLEGCTVNNQLIFDRRVFKNPVSTTEKLILLNYERFSLI